MIDFIPIRLYTPIYYYILLIVVLVVFLSTQTKGLKSTEAVLLNNNFGSFVTVIVILFMGLRPIHGIFADMTLYNKLFENYASGGSIASDKDVFFHVFTKISSKVMSARVYFLLCATLYVVPLYLVCKKWFNNYWFYAFLFLVSSFTFWAYGTNGIRNGIAGSLFLFGISREKRLWQIVFFVLAISFHKTMILPVAGFVIANLYNQPKKMIGFWVLCIPLSLIGGGFFENFFATVGFDDERITYLTDEVNKEKFSSTGFRWDFLLYSAVGVFAGWYYIIKLKFKDRVYFWLFNTYLLANAFWILVIRANYSNRFAYLSWFMISLVIIYPLLKREMIPDQHKKIGYILMAYFGFSFLMNVLLA